MFFARYPWIPEMIESIVPIKYARIRTIAVYFTGCFYFKKN